jgi:enoyl-CoA hydratase/carnithine racemase
VASSVLRLTLPPRLSWADIDRLGAALGTEPEARLVVVEGEGGVFCEGGALDDATEPRPRSFGALLAALERDPRPVIALVDGAALGAGVGLAAAADLVLATHRSRFGLPEALLGLVPAMVFPPLARRIGVARARRLALGAEPLTAEEAYRVGLVDELSDELPAAFARHERRLVRMDKAALASLKALVGRHFGTPAGYDEDAALVLIERMAHADTRDRIRRFLAGETPWPMALETPGKPTASETPGRPTDPRKEDA